MTAEKDTENPLAGRQAISTGKPARDKRPQVHRRALNAQPVISGTATWEWDAESGICNYSPEFADIIGADVSGPRSTRNWIWWSDRMHMDDVPAVLAVYRRFFAGELAEAEILYRLRRQDGRWVRILSRGFTLQWKEDGTPAVISGISLDISHLDMHPPLPESENSAFFCAPGGADEEMEAALQAEVFGQSGLNERRLNALCQLIRMENAPEDEVLRFVIINLLHLTNSARGFLFIPDADLWGRGDMFWSDDYHANAGQTPLPQGSLPVEIARLSTHVQPFSESCIVNGTEGASFQLSFYGAMPVIRYIITPCVEDGRTVLLAGVCNKPTDYDKSDLLQIGTFINSTWHILSRRRHMRDLQKAKQDTEAASMAKREFLANVSHELRTPLNGVLSMLQLLEASPLTEQQREYLQAARLSGNALVPIISDILDFSRIESGKMLLVREPLDFKMSILSCLRLLREEAEKAGLTFTVTTDSAIPDTLMGDEVRIRQIVVNLVGNALKFTRKGGVSVSFRRLPEWQYGKVRILLSVSDTGIGIPKDKQPCLFKAFTQAEEFSAKKKPGTGLGLSIVKHLVEMMQGEIRLESEPGKGTSVSCHIILDALPRPMEDIGDSAPPIGELRSRTLDILVAEDDAVSRFALQSFLNQSGHRVLCVHNGRQALEALQLYPFDCFLTDILMPDMDGLEAAGHIQTGKIHEIPPSREIRDKVRETFPNATGETVFVDPGMTVVAISAHTMAEDGERFLEQGFAHYIAKPIVMRQLSEVLEKVPRRAGK